MELTTILVILKILGSPSPKYAIFQLLLPVKMLNFYLVTWFSLENSD